MPDDAAYRPAAEASAPQTAEPGKSETAGERPESSAGGAGKYVIAALVILLLVLHQDNWFWTSEYLVFGFMPVTLFYHACISIAAAGVWFLATHIAWPVGIIRRAHGTDAREAGR